MKLFIGRAKDHVGKSEIERRNEYRQGVAARATTFSLAFASLNMASRVNSPF
jgi:hypothetical protein